MGRPISVGDRGFGEVHFSEEGKLIEMKLEAMIDSASLVTISKEHNLKSVATTWVSFAIPFMKKESILTFRNSYNTPLEFSQFKFNFEIRISEKQQN